MHSSRSRNLVRYSDARRIAPAPGIKCVILIQGAGEAIWGSIETQKEQEPFTLLPKAFIQKNKSKRFFHTISFSDSFFCWKHYLYFIFLLIAKAIFSVYHNTLSVRPGILCFFPDVFCLPFVRPLKWHFNLAAKLNDKLRKSVFCTAHQQFAWWVPLLYL